MKSAQEILEETSRVLGSVDIEQLPQILEKFKDEIGLMEKELKK